MPNREDGTYVNEKDDQGLRFCSLHAIWYRTEFGCQACFEDSRKTSTESVKVNVQIFKCPNCGKTSLVKNPDGITYECLNLDDRAVFKIKEDGTYFQIGKLIR
jgi:predicted RNA-binding Zn-ribbon protein involved in translation (DUF1610 family)